MLNSMISELTMEGGGALPIRSGHYKFPNAVDIDVIDKQVSKLHYGDVVTLSLHGMFVNAKDRKLNTGRVNRIIDFLIKGNKIQEEVLQGVITPTSIQRYTSILESFKKHLEDYSSRETLYSNTDLFTTIVTKGELIKWVIDIRKLILPWQTKSNAKKLHEGVYNPDSNQSHPVNSWEDVNREGLYSSLNRIIEDIAEQLDEVYVQIYRITEV